MQFQPTKTNSPTQQQAKHSLKRARIEKNVIIIEGAQGADKSELQIQKRQKRFSEPALSKTLLSKTNQIKTTQLTLKAATQSYKLEQLSNKQPSKQQILKKQTTLTSMRKVSILKHLQKSSQRISSPFKANSLNHVDKLSSSMVQTRSTTDSTAFKGTSLSTVTPCSIFDGEDDFYQSISKSIKTSILAQPDSVSWTGAIAKNSISRCHIKPLNLHPKWGSSRKPGLNITLKLPLSKAYNKPALPAHNLSSCSSSSSCSCNINPSIGTSTGFVNNLSSTKQCSCTNSNNSLLSQTSTKPVGGQSLVLFSNNCQVSSQAKYTHRLPSLQQQKTFTLTQQPSLLHQQSDTFLPKKINTRKRVVQSLESSAWRSNKKADLVNPSVPVESNQKYIADNCNVLEYDKAILENPNIKLLSIRDIAAYGHYWLLYELKKELEFQSIWQFSLSGEAENLRLQIIALYWESVKIHPLSAATIYAAVHTFNRLLSTWSKSEQSNVKSKQWPITAVAAFRLACKFEEKPEIFWGISNFWDLFPIFKQWSIDKSEKLLNKAEMDVLQLLNHKINVPIASTFVILYLNGGGWPRKAANFYCNLALYMLSLCTLASTKDIHLKEIIPSKLAAAAVILAIKIINGDRGLVSGMLAHLATCDRPKVKVKEAGPCSCCLEFFPERFQVYTNYQYSELQPVVRGLSSLLRTKPEQAYSLRHFFPLWAEHDWQ